MKEKYTAQKTNKMDEIKIDIHTIDWTEGEHSGLSLMLAKGKTATVAWGDGRKESFVGRLDCLDGRLVWHKFEHYYPCKNYDYTIYICAEDNAIIGFSGMTMFEQNTFRVDVSLCPSLEVFEYSTCGTFPLDVSHNHRLKKIDAREVANEKLDFSANPLLEELNLWGSKNVVSLKLSKNDQLQKLIIPFCENLRRIALSNNSSLNWLVYGYNKLHTRDKEFLLRALKANKPYHLEDVGNDFTSEC